MCVAEICLGLRGPCKGLLAAEALHERFTLRSVPSHAWNTKMLCKAGRIASSLDDPISAGTVVGGLIL